MDNKASEGYPMLRWICMVPVGLLLYVSLLSLGTYALSVLVVKPIIGDDMQKGLVLAHVYQNFICLAVTIYAASLLAPRFRSIVAVCWMIVFLLMTAKVLEVSLSRSFGAMLEWERPLVLWLHIAGAVLPVPFVYLHEWLAKRSHERIVRREQEVIAARKGEESDVHGDGSRIDM